MTSSLILFVIYQLLCTQNILAQFLPLANGYQALLGNPNQILGYRQSAPVYNYVQNQPSLPVINRQTVPVSQVLNLPPSNQLLGLPVLNGAPVLYIPGGIQANTLPIRNVPNVPLTNQVIRNPPLVNQLSSYPFGSVPIVNQLNPLNSSPVNALPFASAPIVNQRNSLPLVNALNSASLANVPVVYRGVPANLMPSPNVPNANPLANALANILYNSLVVPNTLPVINNAPSYTSLPLPVNNLQINPYQILNNVPAGNYISNSPNVISNVPIVNALGNNGNRNLNVLPVNSLVLGQPNNVFANVPVLNSAQIIASPQPIKTLPIAKDFGLQGLTLLVDSDLAEPLVSLNGLQLGGVGGLGNLPLFNGLPVIGMKESIFNLSAV